MICLIFPILEIFSTELVFSLSLKNNSLYKYIRRKKIDLKCENFIYPNTQSISHFLLRFRPTDFRFAAFFFEGFLALCWTSSASHLIPSLVLALDSISLPYFSLCWGLQCPFLRLKYFDFHDINYQLENVI